RPGGRTAGRAAGLPARWGTAASCRPDNGCSGAGRRRRPDTTNEGKVMIKTRSRRVRAKRPALALSTSLALVAGTVALTVPASADESPVPDLHYTMDDVTGSTVPDTSGNGWDGTISGSTGTVETDDGGTALDLVGGDDGGYVSLPREV